MLQHESEAGGVHAGAGTITFANRICRLDMDMAKLNKLSFLDVRDMFQYLHQRWENWGN